MTQRNYKEDDRRISIFRAISLDERHSRIPLAPQDQIYTSLSQSVESFEHSYPSVKRNLAIAVQAANLLGIDPEKILFQAKKGTLNRMLAEDWRKDDENAADLLVLTSLYVQQHGNNLSDEFKNRTMYNRLAAEQQAAGKLEVTVCNTGVVIASLLTLFPKQSRDEITQKYLGYTFDDIRIFLTKSLNQSSTLFAAQQAAYMRLINQERFDKEALLSETKRNEIERELQRAYSSQDWLTFIHLAWYTTLLEATALAIDHEGVITFSSQRSGEKPIALPKIRREGR